MKEIKLFQRENDSEVNVQKEKTVVLEPISLIELAEVLGGNNENSTVEKDDDKDGKGRAGGLVCWC